LDYALKPAGPELEREFSPHYLDELLFFKMFTVDYVLGLKSVNNPLFASVRQHYNGEIEKGCMGSSRLRIFYETAVARFATYSEACNANTLAPKECKGERIVFWELGKAFSCLASDADPWVPSALEVTLHANIFLRECKRLSDFLEQCDIAQTV
jgi:hypothetical protein